MATAYVSSFAENSRQLIVGWLGETLAYLFPKIRGVWGDALPDLGIVCGSGLNTLSQSLDSVDLEIKFSDIPHFGSSSVVGHQGVMQFGRVKNLRVVILLGRLHFYEGYPIQRSIYPVLLLSMLGIKYLLLSNAAGGINTSYKVGDIMLITDHLFLAGFAGLSPLVGPHITASDFAAVLENHPSAKLLSERFQSGAPPRFVPLNNVYDLGLQRLFAKAFKACGSTQSTLHCGVYAFVAGPQYETPAEIRALKTLGADAVGMSTVPEVIIGAQCGVKVIAFSLITNEIPTSTPLDTIDWLYSEEVCAERVGPNHEEVIAAAKTATDALVSTVRLFCDHLAGTVN